MTDEECRVIGAERVHCVSHSYDRVDVLVRPRHHRSINLAFIHTRAMSLCGLPPSDRDVIFTHDWASDQCSRGSYAYYGIGSLNLEGPAAREADGPLFFAGDYVLPGLCGYMEGAVRSAQIAANGALAYVGESHRSHILP